MTTLTIVIPPDFTFNDINETKLLTLKPAPSFLARW